MNPRILSTTPRTHALPTLAPPDDRETAACMASLAELAAMLDGLPWVLAGGLNIPLTLGAFYRHHHDIDFAFPVEAFPDIEAAMRRAGFRLSTRVSGSLFGAFRFALHVPIRSTGLVGRLRRRRLKFGDATGARPSSDLLAVMDALPYRIRRGRVETCDGRHRLPLVRPLVAGRVPTAAGHEIPCLDLYYVHRFKGGRRDPADLVDYALIEEAEAVRAAREAPRPLRPAWAG